MNDLFYFRNLNFAHNVNSFNIVMFIYIKQLKNYTLFRIYLFLIQNVMFKTE